MKLHVIRNIKYHLPQAVHRCCRAARIVVKTSLRRLRSSFENMQPQRATGARMLTRFASRTQRVGRLAATRKKLATPRAGSATGSARRPRSARSTRTQLPPRLNLPSTRIHHHPRRNLSSTRLRARRPCLVRCWSLNPRSTRGVWPRHLRLSRRTYSHVVTTCKTRRDHERSCSWRFRAAHLLGYHPRPICSHTHSARRSACAHHATARHRPIRPRLSPGLRCLNSRDWCRTPSPTQGLASSAVLRQAIDWRQSICGSSSNAGRCRPRACRSSCKAAAHRASAHQPNQCAPPLLRRASNVLPRALRRSLLCPRATTPPRGESTRPQPPTRTQAPTQRARQARAHAPRALPRSAHTRRHARSPPTALSGRVPRVRCYRPLSTLRLTIARSAAKLASSPHQRIAQPTASIRGRVLARPQVSSPKAPHTGKTCLMLIISEWLMLEFTCVFKHILLYTNSIMAESDAFKHMRCSTNRVHPWARTGATASVIAEGAAYWQNLSDADHQ